MSLSGNPLKYDAELKGLIDRLDTVTSYRQFRRWKASFLSRFESFLTEKGMRPAEESYQKFSENMETFEKKVNQVDKFLQNGKDLTADRTTVKARNALNELHKNMGERIAEIEALIPSTGADERRRRYTKYHLGAILVRDGFSEYDRMLRCQTKLNEDMVGPLQGVADKQQLEEISNYNRQIQRFKDVMDDLGLYEVMLKCREFADGDMDEIILLDPKTGSLIELPRKVLFERGLLSLIPDANGNDVIREAETSRVEKQEMIGTIRTAFKV